VANALYQMNQQVGLVTNGRDAADRIRQEGWDYDIRSRKAARKAAAMLEQSERLQPVVVETRRGPEQLMRVLETLARVEVSDGLDLAGLIAETVGRMPRDATVLAVLPSVSNQSAVALGNLRRKGFAVTAIVNVYDREDFEEASGRLAAEGIEARHLRDPEGISTICRSYVLR
jgi:hypothetical protein